MSTAVPGATMEPTPQLSLIALEAIEDAAILAGLAGAVFFLGALFLHDSMPSWAVARFWRPRQRPEMRDAP
jgi:hypothetical protein